ncbi:MAG TPA: cation:proton antiporter [Thermoplasmata archaeon]|nr:cation:proton antiporter [Thermoplasmata archaeon]
MVTEAELLFQLGAILLLAFLAATMAGRANQSVMVGYIVLGIFIGPKMSLELFGVEYHGLISDTSLVEVLSFMGLIMLMFFVGLEFSFSKLKKTKTPAIILAIIDTSIGLFVGFLFASYLGWPLIDSIFLAGVIAMSSTSVAMKILFDLKKMSSPEVEFLIGLVVVETFIAMLILAVASGMIIEPETDAVAYGKLLLGMAAFYGFFVWVAMWAIPRVVAFFNRIDNDELFILFALGIVFLTAGVASLMNVPPIIGAFFIGMILAESKVSTRIQSKLESFKDAFVAIFFTSFGMMIDPAMFDTVIWMVLLAMPIIVFYETIVISAVSYFIGFSAKAASTIGTSMCGRGVESILYASVGSEVRGTTMGAQLNPFAGALCFGMSAVAPFMVKNSIKFANLMSRIVPRHMQFSGAVVSRTLGKVVMPSSLKMFKGTKMTGILLFVFVLVSAAMLMTDSMLHIIFLAADAMIAGALYFVIRYEVAEIVRHVNYNNIGVGVKDRAPIVNLITRMIFGALVSVMLIVSTWNYVWQLSVFVAIGYGIFAAGLTNWAYNKLYIEGFEIPTRVYSFSRLDDEPATNVGDDLPDVPKPVYGVLKTLSGDSRL